MAGCQSLSYTPQNFRRRTSHLIHYTSDFASHTRTHTSRPPSHTLKISDPPHEVQHLRPYSSDVGPIFVIALQTSHLRARNSDLATFLTLLFCVVVYLKNRCDAKRCDAMRCDAIRCEAMRCAAMLLLLLLLLLLRMLLLLLRKPRNGPFSQALIATL